MIFGDDENAVNPDNSAILQANNLYSYCINDPINYQDSNGERSESFTGKMLSGLARINEYSAIWDVAMFLKDTKEKTEILYDTLAVHVFNVYHADRDRGFLQINGITNDSNYKRNSRNLNQILDINGIDVTKPFNNLTDDEITEIVDILKTFDGDYTKELIAKFSVDIVSSGVSAVYGV